MKKQGGFTLIELVVVIVILGILAVTAAPKFLNLQEDARKSSLQGLKGAMTGAAGIVYGKAAIEGKENSDSTENVEGIDTIFGYPRATANGIALAVTGLPEDWSSAISGATYLSTFEDGTLTASQIVNTGCYVTYAEATGTDVTSAAVVTVTDGSC
jgi:MSHA pilin protein MshA